MAQAFTITQQTFNFTATVVSNLQGISLTTQPLNVSQTRQGYTATIVRNNLGVSSTGTYTVNIAPSPVSVFTATDTDILIGVVEQTIANVTVTNVAENISVTSPATPITINYNPTLVEHVFDGQPVYTTSSVQFKSLTLGNTSTFTFPADDGANGYALLTDGLGQLYWGLGGGGGGLGQWSLNTNLLTNGFTITSGSSSVDLKIVAGGFLVGLTPERLFLGLENEYPDAEEGGIVIRNADARLTLIPTKVEVGVDDNNQLSFDSDFFEPERKIASLTADGTQISLQQEDVQIVNKSRFAMSVEEGLTWPRISLVHKSVNITGDSINIGTTSSVATITGVFAANDGIRTPSLTNPGGVVNVGILRFADGSQLSTALVGTSTVYTTGTFVLNGDLLSNGYDIKLSDNSILTNADGFNDAGGIRFDSSGTHIVWAMNEDVDDPHAFIKVGRDDPLSDPRIEIKSSNINISSDTGIRVNRLLFPDGTVQTSAIPPATGTVSTIVPGEGIAVSTSTGVVEVSNVGVVRAIPANDSILITEFPHPFQWTQPNAQSGTVYIGIGRLPIIQGYGMLVDQTFTTASTILSVNTVTLANNIIAGSGINITRNGGQVTINTTATMNNILQGDLKTNGFKIDGETNDLVIEAGKFQFLTSIQSSKISMPRNAPLEITSDFGITLDTPDQNPIKILSPFQVLHRDGASRISTDALGQTTLNDTRIAITGTNRVVINKSNFFNESITLQTTATGSSLYLGPTEAILTATNFRVATTATFKVGSDLFNSRLAVQEITNFNETGPVTFRRGIQFQDLTVQRTAYIGGLDFGSISAPATNMEQFLLQLQTVDFGTVTSPSTLAFDAGVIE